MNFKRKQKVFVLNFDGTELEGLVVRARSASLGEGLRFQELAEVWEAAKGSNSSKALRELITEFSSVLLSWNMTEEDGTEVPADFDGLMSIDIDDVMRIINAWQVASSGVAAPLEIESRSGESSLAGSLPMETLSPSRAS